MFSKLIEIIILDKIEMYMDINLNQFAFKKKHGNDVCILMSDQCIYVSKEALHLYCFTCIKITSR